MKATACRCRHTKGDEMQRNTLSTICLNILRTHWAHSMSIRSKIDLRKELRSREPKLLQCVAMTSLAMESNLPESERRISLRRSREMKSNRLKNEDGVSEIESRLRKFIEAPWEFAFSVENSFRQWVCVHCDATSTKQCLVHSALVQKLRI